MPRKTSVLLLLAALAVSNGLAVAAARSTLQKALIKNKGAVTVSVELTGDGFNDTVESLSRELRKSKASAIACSHLNVVATLAAEQATAKGDFPGPCPVLYTGPVGDALAAAKAGASAVVLAAKDIDVAAELDGSADVVWLAECTDEIDAIVAAGYGSSSSSAAFLVDGQGETSIVDALPDGAWVIASLSSMQPDSAEIEQGRSLAASGVATSLLLRAACIGDEEDLPYARYAISGVTRKASSTFKCACQKIERATFRNTLFFARAHASCSILMCAGLMASQERSTATLGRVTGASTARTGACGIGRLRRRSRCDTVVRGAAVAIRMPCIDVWMCDKHITNKT